MRLGLRGLWVWAAVVWTACSSSPGSPDVSETSSCTYESCRAACREMGREYGSCSGGTCHCAVPADAEVPDRGDSGNDGREVDGDGRDAATSCDGIRVPGEERPGASPGVTCRRVSVEELEPYLMDFSGDGPWIVFRGGHDRPRPLLKYHRETRCIDVVDDAVVPGLDRTSAVGSSVEGSRVAYCVAGTARDTGQSVWQLRLIDDIRAPAPRVLVETRSERREGRQSGMDFPTLHYPWITWRDVREANWYAWVPYAYNIETGEERKLVPEPTSPGGGGAVMVDNDGRFVVFTGAYADGTGAWADNVYAVDLRTGAGSYVHPRMANQFWPSITPDWIVWLDQYSHPECDYMIPCYTDVYGYHRSTGEVVPLVVAGESMQGPWMDARGDWVAYEDQRDGSDVTRSLDNEQDIYALHLPTRTEVRITDWPGFEWNPQVYDRHDGTYGVLLIQEIDYLYAIYRLWDCDLPTPVDGP